MDTIELDNKNSVELPYGDITHAVQFENIIEFTFEKNDGLDDEYRFISISGKNTYKKINFKDKVRIQISGDIEVFCEDWTPDENIDESNINGTSFRRSAIEGCVDFNWERTIGEEWCDLPSNYIEHLDLEFAMITKLCFDNNYKDGKFLLVLEAPYNDPQSEQTHGYYTGPFRFYCINVKLIID